MSIPQSTISICSNVRLNSRYEHTIYFADRTAQLNYFAGKVVKTFSAYSFIRKTWDLNVAATMEEAAAWSYLFFTNTANGKRYFYFIDNIEYVNDGTVRLKLQIDVLQTYLFDFDLLPCFVERQHTITDGIGDHTVDEGLELGEMTTNTTRNIDPGKLAIMVMCTTNPNATNEVGASQRSLPYMYNRVFSGVKIWAVNPDKWVAWGQQLETLDELGVPEAIVAMWMYPMQLVKLPDGVTWTGTDIAVPVEGAVAQQDASLVYAFDKNVAKIDGYEPKNNKLFTYPFNFVYCTDNAGTSAAYRFERFEGDKINFVLSGSLSPDGGVHMTPIDYNGKEYNYHEGMTLRGFPTCAWDSDIYKMWLAQNQHSNALSLGMAGLKIVGGVAAAVATGGLGAVVASGSVVSGAATIASHLAQRADRDIQPPQAKGNFSASVNITNNMLAFTLDFQSVTAERARIIDDFFTMYGYKINRVQKPEIHARKSHTYIKTIGCHIDAELCNEDATKIESIFDNGVTFWTKGDRIGQYTDDNSTL